jgi:hypothetical protein
VPEFLKKKLQAEYPGNPRAVWGTLNDLGAVRGNKETAKGAAMQAKHNRDVKAGAAQGMKKATSSSFPHKNLGAYLHPKKGK